jgi:hypothetical protein
VNAIIIPMPTDRECDCKDLNQTVCVRCKDNLSVSGRLHHHSITCSVCLGDRLHCDECFDRCYDECQSKYNTNGNIIVDCECSKLPPCNCRDLNRTLCARCKKEVVEKDRNLYKCDTCRTYKTHCDACENTCFKERFPNFHSYDYPKCMDGEIECKCGTQDACSNP